MILSGRREIFTDETKITAENIPLILQEAFPIHQKNRIEIEYLQKYEKGIQPILHRVKEIRPEINCRVVENHANEITTFKVGYIFGSPITFVQRASVDSKSSDGKTDDERISLLNKSIKVKF